MNFLKQSWSLYKTLLLKINIKIAIGKNLKKWKYNFEVKWLLQGNIYLANPEGSFSQLFGLNYFMCKILLLCRWYCLFVHME